METRRYPAGSPRHFRSRLLPAPAVLAPGTLGSGPALRCLLHPGRFCGGPRRLHWFSRGLREGRNSFAVWQGHDKTAGLLCWQSPRQKVAFRELQQQQAAPPPDRSAYSPGKWARGRRLEVLVRRSSPCHACNAHGPRNAKDDGGKPVPVLRSERLEPAASPSQKVREAGRDFTYLIVVLIGISITGSLLYTIFKELFSSSSPNKIYGKALEKCRIHPEVISIFGKPLKGYGEMSRRGRRQHVSFIEYVKDGLKHMRLKFYIEGSEPGKQGTVHVEVKENPENGKYEFRYIFVETESFPRRTIVIEDNRSQDS
ncbi:PREDICTED: mitochondrial import inner membrane translocase subunit Tim21 [Dipodomys ordii]|uniref:Mitochondrial import inner membrane translocase subunit Tim21 n=1 Tax=Dipodomys ordii TaxID=10020 RepID=A0A1S3FYD0_DIPOR|nr:PREDICTED: mitochondrial import inner membrane translocase subunit Tim21 [Dipodomys ordii]